MQTPKTSISYNLVNDKIAYTTENVLISQIKKFLKLTIPVGKLPMSLS
ncbi:hypothetical protein [Flavivirga rizhaonensis]|nr:hypothetical protein [Flavivirga rizhaonensis]